MTVRYATTATLLEEAGWGLYRGMRSHDQEPVIIKIVRDEARDPRPAERLRREYKVSSRLDSPYVLEPHELLEQQGQAWLVFAEFDSEPLSRRLGQPIDLESFFDTAGQLAAALADIHRQDIRHNDLQPTGILVQPESGAIKLTGFGVATRLAPSPAARTNVRLLDSSLVYASPEQTGRMNRGVDHRSDLYSLGVIFYEMLTGQQPFQAADPLEWAHCHIARPPRPLTEIVPTIPDLLAAVVLKLLAKQAEDRYQTAAGLRADLESCRVEWQRHRSIAPFPLGTRDVYDHLLIPQKLYGRQREVGALLAAFDRVVQSGTPELVLVSGYPGVGKSAVVNELHKALLPRRVLFAGGKVDQYKQGIPYATLTQALQALIRQVLGRGEEEVAEWRKSILQAVGPNGRLVTSLVPDLVALIGEQPSVPDVPPQNAQNRFNNVVRRLLCVFASPGRPLVLFLDNLQWLDAATLQLVEHLLIHPAVRHLLVLGAYRDSQVDPSHPLVQALDSMRKGRAAVQSIVLGPLVKEDVLRITAGAFHCEEGRAEPLAQLVGEKTGGNPFFTIQFLTELADEGLVELDGRTARWRWDLARIRGKGFTDNVADLMVGKLCRLPADTQLVLTRLACLGNNATVHTLALILKEAEEKIGDDLQEAIQAGFLLQQGDTVSFLHDRVQEAAYALIPEEERAAVHLGIGRTLLAHAGPDPADDVLFAMVGHLNRGVGLITEPDEKTRLAQLNATAGRRARQSTAFATARDFLAAAAALLPDEEWETRYAFLFALYLDWAECEYLRGVFDGAEPILDLLLGRAKSHLDKAAVYELRLTIYPIAGKYEEAIEMGTRALELLGETIPRDNEELARATEAEAEAAKENLRGRNIGDLGRGAEATDPRAKAVTGLLTSMADPAYIAKPELYPFLAFRNVNYALTHGVTKDSGRAFTGYANLMVALEGDAVFAHGISEMALALTERFGELRHIGSAYYLHGNHINHWLNPIATDFPVLERGFRVCLDSGNLVYANYIAYSIIWQAVERGDPLGNVLDLSQEFVAFALGSRNEAIHQTIVLELQFLKCLMGETDGRISFGGSGVDERSCVERIARASFTCGVTYYHTMKTMAAYLMGDDAASREHAEHARQVIAAVMGQPMEATYYLLQALVLARACRDTPELERADMMDTLAACRSKLNVWARNCPANFACKYELVSAEMEALQGNTLAAARLFERAIDSAAASGFVHWQAMANEAAARLYASRGLETPSRAYLCEARRCYARWGASAKVDLLDASHPWLAEEAPAGRCAMATRTEQLDVMAIIKAQHAISGEISLDRLAQALLRIIMESAGAQTGVLAVEGAGRLRAEMRPDDGSDLRIVFRHAPETADLPETIMNYVRRSRDTVILDDARTHPGDFSADNYLRRVEPKSLLCMAIQRQEKLLAVLYLENNLATGAFTAEHCSVLEVLTAQAAVSLEIAAVSEALQQSEERMRVTMEATQIGVFDWDVEHDIWYATPEYYTMLGYDAKDDPGNRQEWLERVHPDDRAHVENEIRTVQAGDASGDRPIVYEYQARLRHADGTYRWGHVKGFGVERDEHGRLTRVVGTRVDITQQKEAEEEIRQLNQELEQRVLSRTAQLEAANRDLEAFAFSVSHDLRAPLRHIEGFLDLLDKQVGGALDPKARHYMETISDATGRMGKLIDDLLSFARTGRQEMSLREVNLALVTRDVIAELDVANRGRRIEWRVGDLPKVDGDASMLRVVMMNLFSNAVKFTRTREQAIIEVGSEERKGGTCVFVRDNGVGFDQEYASGVFEVFQRLHPEDEFEGTGVGLAIVQRIINRHGGRVRAEGKTQQGATVSFFLPRRANRA